MGVVIGLSHKGPNSRPFPQCTRTHRYQHPPCWYVRRRVEGREMQPNRAVSCTMNFNASFISIPARTNDLHKVPLDSKGNRAPILLRVLILGLINGCRRCQRRRCRRASGGRAAQVRIASLDASSRRGLWQATGRRVAFVNGSLNVAR